MIGDFELEIDCGSASGEFRLRCKSPDEHKVGQDTAHPDLARLLAERDALRHASSSGLKVTFGDSDELQQAGSRLFQTFFPDGIAEGYRDAKRSAEEDGRPLRVVLRLAARQLDALPWETLFDADDETYLCRAGSLVRCIPSSNSGSAAEPTPHLRVLAVFCCPNGSPQMDVTTERERISTALDESIVQGSIELTWLAQPTWEALQETLLSAEWHVLHFIGFDYHAVSPEKTGIVLVRRDGSAHPVHAQQLADLLNEARPTPRLVVLNTCDSSATAAVLARRGISAVVAMQFVVSDKAAAAFSGGFFTALARGHGVDDAVRSGRIAIMTDPDTAQWLNPVLYVRGDTAALSIVAVPSRSNDSSAPTGSSTPRAAAGQSRQGIFICYRRSDSRWPANLMADALTERFGADSVFRDVDSLHVGNWRTQIDQSLAGCAVVLVVIGPRWLAEFGNRAGAKDEVRYEIAEALKLGKILVPVAVDGAKLPDRDDLPEDISALSEAQGYELGVDSMWDPTVGRVLDELSALLAQHEHESDARQQPAEDQGVP